MTDAVAAPILSENMLTKVASEVGDGWTDSGKIKFTGIELYCSDNGFGWWDNWDPYGILRIKESKIHYWKPETLRETKHLPIKWDNKHNHATWNLGNQEYYKFNSHSFWEVEMHDKDGNGDDFIGKFKMNIPDMDCTGKNLTKPFYSHTRNENDEYCRIKLSYHCVPK